MSETTTNRPIKEFRVRNLRAAIWQNEVERDGERVLRHSVTLNKRYRDPNTGAWADSNSFFPDDLPRLRLLLEKAYEHIMLKNDVAPGEAHPSGVGQDDPRRPPAHVDEPPETASALANGV